MGIAISLQEFLDGRGVSYDVMVHDRTATAAESAEACAISKDNLAKGVLVRRKNGYALAIVPASCRVDLAEIGTWLHEPVGLATEEEVEAVFGDCESGSIPPVPPAYGLPAVIDDSLEGLQDIYFEGGDHCSLVHVKGREFHTLLRDVPHAHISTGSH